MTMTMDYSKLRGRIVEKCGNHQCFAREMPISHTSLSRKLNSHSDWTQAEIIRACEVLDIGERDICDYFFKVDVQNSEHRKRGVAGNEA